MWMRLTVRVREFIVMYYYYYSYYRYYFYWNLRVLFLLLSSRTKMPLYDGTYAKQLVTGRIRT